ncbi:MAG: hypothetical protein AAF682_12975 [Planctomycetota bacterium]
MVRVFIAALLLLVAVVAVLWNGNRRDASSGGEDLVRGESAGSVGSGLSTATSGDPGTSPRVPLEPDAEEPGEVSAPAEASRAGGDEEHLNHAAVQALAAFHGADPRDVVAEIEESWPALLDMEVAPLGDWELVAPTLPEELMADVFGRSPKDADYLFEAQSVGVSLEEYVQAELGDVDPLVASDRLWECRAALEPHRALFDEYHREFEAALRTKIARGEFDRSPYIQLSGYREHTNQSGRHVRTALGVGLGDSCWSVVVEFYHDEFPELEAAKRRWIEARERAAREIAEILDA